METVYFQKYSFLRAISIMYAYFAEYFYISNDISQDNNRRFSIGFCLSNKAEGC